jgi:L-tartrate/succinate antiporter
MFLTELAPNLLTVELVNKTVHVNLTWIQWFIAFLPAGLVLPATTLALAHAVYPPELKKCPEVPAWALQQLEKLGRLTRKEVVLLSRVLLALGLWIFGAELMDLITAALVVVDLLVVTRTINWSDVLADRPAFNTLIWFGTLVPLAGGLA